MLTATASAPTSIYLITVFVLTSPKNLVARGEHQKPVAGGSGGNATTSPSYDTNHNALNMDPSGEGPADFGYGAPGQGDY